MDFKPESTTIEYKEAKNSVPKDFWETYSAFANTHGGTVFFGVSEGPKGTFTATGVKASQKVIVDMMTNARNQNRASINLLTDSSVNVINDDGNEIIEVFIPEADKSDKPVYIGGNTTRAFIRNNESDNLMTPPELRYYISEAGNAYDGDVIEGYTIDDLSSKDVRAYQAIVADRENDNLLDLSIPDFLEKVGVLKKIRNSGSDQKYITVSGLLFFGKFNSITEKFPSFHLDFMRKTSSANPDFIDRIVTANFGGSPENIFSFYQEVERKINSTIENPFELSDSGFTRKDPGHKFMGAIREALTNALSHAYYKSAKGISITQYPDYFEFENPGELRVTKEQFIFGGQTEPRNPQLVLLFRRAGWSERGGTGGPRIFEISDDLNLKVPDIQSDRQQTTLRIWNIDFAKGIQIDYQLNDSERIFLDALRETNRNMLTASEVKLLIPAKRQYDNAVASLLEKELIIRGGKGRGTFFVLTRPDTERAHNMQKFLRSIEDDLIRKN
ncbi:RNA-binding domain-containing protein [Weissella confusa]|uniref:RNA-binding domain-containing protein n=1 Tax=Weissella confusa TaxID=1583 RepID=UPI0018F1A77B|nr:RNA-binding domain-containing protein [Weissella confusa]MBJ7658974.1 hypothetical protein [Weissella confusa]